MAAGPAAAQQPAPDRPPGNPSAGEPRIVGQGQLAEPETALWDDQADVYLVSNVNGGFATEDGNGFISRISPDGKVLKARWIDGKNPAVTLNAPKGMIFVGDELWVCDINVVRVFDRKTGAQKGSHTLLNSTLLNYLVEAPDGAVYVTDSGGMNGPPGAIYKIMGKKPATVITRGAYLQRPDGIAMARDGSGLLVTTYAAKANAVYRLSFDGKRSAYAMLPSPQLDGLLRLPDGSLLVTSWKGQAVYRLTGTKSEVLVTNVPSPAQIGYDAKRHELLVPSVKQSELLVVPLEQ
ncbi:MAG TPA: SMP-30/gluconolactonase/LRE family protein [Gammaproteobacteria bacterium]|nr:SMP-30/gluconolactonase/LRE family protein [Gammaproteobacteria bacterium]